MWAETIFKSNKNNKKHKVLTFSEVSKNTQINF